MKSLSCFLLACFCVSSSYALPDFDPFADATANGGTAYTADSNLIGQTNAAGHGWLVLNSNAGGNQPVIAATNLAYPNLPPSTGNAVSLTPGAGYSARLRLNTTVNTPPIYYSFLLKITDLSAVGTGAANNFFCGFSDAATTQATALVRCGTRVVTKKSGAGYLIGVGGNNTTAEYLYDPTVHLTDETLFIVGSYENAGGATNTSLWINPSSLTWGSNAPPPPTLFTNRFANIAGALNAAGVAGFVLSCQNAGPGGIVDDLRIGTSWAFVTTDPAINVPPQNLSLPAGATAAFTVVANGTPTLAYQWIKNGTNFLTDGGIISGSATATLTLTGISASDGGSYSVMVTNSLGTNISPAATLTVSDPAVATQPVSQTKDYGTTATFTAVAAGTGPFTYQWQKNGVALGNGGNVSGAKTSALTLTGASYLDAADYALIVTNNLGNSITSSVATLTVHDPVVTTQPVSLTNIAGTTAAFSVVAVGSPSLGYQWQHAGTNLTDGGKFSGAASASLTVTSVAQTEAGSYDVIVSGGSGSNAISSTASLTVIDPASIFSPPASRTVAIGDPVAFVVGAGGTGPFTYQWRYEGVAIADATTFAYSIANADPTNAGNYTVVVSNSLNSITSAPALLTVLSPPLRLYDTNLVVVRVGNGVQAFSLNGSLVFLDQFTTSGTYVNTISIPSSGASALIEATPDITGSVLTGTALTRSVDKRYMVLSGYNVPLGFGSSLPGAAGTSAPRGIALIDANGQYSLPVSDTSAYSQEHWRGAASDGANNFWGCGGAGGTWYMGLTASSIVVQNFFVNTRSVDIFNGNVYAVSASGVNGVIKMAGLPTAFVTPVQLFAGTSTTTDLAVDPTGNLIYVSFGNGIQRWEFDGSNWSHPYNLTNGISGGTRYVTCDFSGPAPVVYTTSVDGGAFNRIVSIVDTGASSVSTTLATVGPNQLFRGIRFGPVLDYSPPPLAITRDLSNVILSWSGPSILQSATNVNGPYVDVPDSHSPFTNNVAPDAQRFFRLRN